MMTPLEARLTEENAALRTQLEAANLEIKLLREKIDLLVRRIFGRSSEQLDDNQLMLLLQGGDDGAKKDPASHADPGVLEAEIHATRHDIAIPRQSMARWLGLAADWLRPVYEHIHTGVMAGARDMIAQRKAA